MEDMERTITTATVTRRTMLRRGLAGTAVGMAALAGSVAPQAHAEADEQDSAQVGAIYRLQAAFHRAKTTQDLALMMALWAEDGTLTNQGDPHSPYVGADRLRAFWQQSGSFTHHRFSLVPSFKTQIAVHGEEAWLYFECHDIGDFDLPSRFIASDTFLAGTVRKMEDRWVFGDMTAGKSALLSVDHYYFP